MAKKMAARDLKHDELQEQLQTHAHRLVEFLGEHGKMLLIAALALVLIAFGWSLFSSQQAGALEEARSAFDEALSVYTEVDTAAAGGQEADWAKAEASLQEFVGSHDGDLSDIASYFLGVSQTRGGKHDDAVSTLGALTGSGANPELRPLALSVLAGAEESRGNVDAAITTLEQLRTTDWPSYPADTASFLLAELFERHGRESEALAIYEELDSEPAEGEIRTAVSSAAQAKVAELGEDDGTES
ncbi:MAG: tetratricopeptide repeat protein [Acidobacteriota bacterium]